MNRPNVTTRQAALRVPLRSRWHARAAAAAGTLLFACAAAVVQPARAAEAPGPAATPQGERFDFNTTPGHLPKTVRPLRQQLELELDPAAAHFEARGRYTLDVREPVAAIVLHAHELVARAVALEGDAQGPRTLAVRADDTRQTWTLTPTDGRPIEPGTHTLRLAWRGTVNASDEGLFRVPYRGERVGKQAPTQEVMLATQLEAVFARQVFPAFDEPAFRSVFELTVRAPATFEVLSNTARTDQTVLADGRVQHRFAPTPPMPAYLFAVAVGRFEALAGEADGVPMRVLTAPGRAAHGAYALALSQQLLPYYSGYFGQRYALSKLDHLAVPGVRGGAMEDWGLISYIEDGLLFDPQHAGVRQRRGVFRLVAHEMAHQWFGNLVTAASWEEIWLNEAFATWMENKAAARFNPEWRLELRRRADASEAMMRDAGVSTRAIRSGAVPEDRVFDVFDDITYTKGGAVLGMLEAWIGEDAFQRGLAAYMRERRLSNATAADLWHHIGEAAGRDVRAVASNWTDRRGLPLVALKVACVDGRTELTLSQRPFVTGDATQGGIWQVPLVIQHDGRDERHLLTLAEDRLTLAGCPAQPTLANADAIGFFRVDYDAEHRARLLQQFAALPDTARLVLLDDAYQLAHAGTRPLADWLDVLAAAARTPRGPARDALLVAASAQWRTLAQAFRGTDVEGAVQAAIRALYAPELARLGWAPRAEDDTFAEDLRAVAIQLLGSAAHAPTVAQANALFDAERAGGSRIAGSVRAAVLGVVGWHADAARFDALETMMRAATLHEERRVLFESLALASDDALARRVLGWALDGRLPNDLSTAAAREVAGNPAHAELAYAFTLEHWAALVERGGSMWGARHWLLPAVAFSFTTTAQADRLLADQQRLIGDPGAAPAAQTAAHVRGLAALRERERSAEVTAALARFAARAGS